MTATVQNTLCVCGCGRPSFARGLSNTCYNRTRRQQRSVGQWRAEERVPAIGSTRRLRALTAIGWPYRDLAPLYGPHARGTMALLLGGRQEHVTVSTAGRIAAIFEQLQMVPGPSDVSRRRALVKGWAPPLAWDEDAIDDPAAEPDWSSILQPGRRGRVSWPEFIDMVADHRSVGHYDEDIAEAMGLSLETFQKRLHRAGLSERRRGAGDITAPTRVGHHSLRLPRPVARAYVS